MTDIQKKEKLVFSSDEDKKDKKGQVKPKRRPGRRTQPQSTTDKKSQKYSY